MDAEVFRRAVAAGWTRGEGEWKERERIPWRLFRRAAETRAVRLLCDRRNYIVTAKRIVCKSETCYYARSRWLHFGHTRA